MSQDCNCSENQTSSFIFGLFLGAIVAAVVAILIHRHQKSKVVVQLKQYFQDLIDRLIPPSSPKTPDTPKKTKTTPIKKIAVDIPQNIKTFSPTLPKKKTPVKTFVKPRK
jgi:gas vesicle protein